MAKSQKLRLLNIDTPEVRGAERAEGLVARDALRNKILDKTVVINSTGKGKYGRWLVEIFLEEENINNWLLTEGYAKPYS